MERYTTGSKIGTGAFGQVLEARLASTPTEPFNLAAKFIKLSDNTALAMALNEGKVLADLSHPNVVKAMESFVTEGTVGVRLSWFTFELCALYV